jgi:hypothetical protein
VSQEPSTSTTGRSILAVLAGMFITIVITILTDVILHAVGVFPPLGASMTGYEGALVLATVYRTIYGVAGCYITARLAPHRPMKHALIGGFIGLVVSVVGAIATWNKGPAFGPHCYPVALVILALPTAWLGGKIRIMQLQQKQSMPSAH